MEEVQDDLKEVILEQLKQCKENKTVPSKELLSTIITLNNIYYM